MLEKPQVATVLCITDMKWIFFQLWYKVLFSHTRFSSPSPRSFPLLPSPPPPPYTRTMHQSVQFVVYYFTILFNFWRSWIRFCVRQIMLVDRELSIHSPLNRVPKWIKGIKNDLGKFKAPKNGDSLFHRSSMK